MLNKIFTVCIMSLFLSNAAFAFSEDNISALEYSKYGRNYPYESLGERLTRLETDYFGMSQTGDIDSRIANLSKINSNRKNGVTIPSYGNYSDVKPKNGIRDFWNNIKSGFSDNGYITGYTPSMTYTTSSGYANDLYKNHLYGYNNNYQSFCPYDNGFHNRVPNKPSGYYNNRYFNPSFSGFNGVNSFVPNTLNSGNKYRHRTGYNNYHNHYNHNHYNPHNFSPYNRPYTNRSTYYSPPNIQAKSSVHILQD